MGVAELTRNAVHVLPAGALETKLALGRPLRVKLGIDVTSPDIHVGRGITLQKMRAFQDEGHIGVLIVGDYTTRIGDPSGRSAERPILSEEEIERNADTYVEQALQILVPEQTEVRRNSEWLAKLSFADVIRLTRIMTVAQMLERDDFAGRYAARPADLGLGAPLPADAGLRLRRGRGRRRAGGHRPALQPPRRARGDAGVRPGAAGRSHDAAAPLLGRREDELVGRQQHPADRSSGGAVRAHNAHLRRAPRGVVSARRRGARPCRRSARREARARTLDRRALARGGAARAAEEHFTRSSARGARPKTCPSTRFRTGTGPPPRSPRLGVRPLDERSAPADRAGWGQGGRSRGVGARRAALGRSSAPSSRPGSGGSHGSRSSATRPENGLVDTRISCATIPRPSARRVQEACNSTRRKAFERADTTSVVPSPRASGASQRFFVAVVLVRAGPAWVFENSTA